MKKILFITHTSSLQGGASISLLSLLKGIRSKTEIIVLLPNKGDLEVKLEELSINYKIVKFMPSSALFYKSNKLVYLFKAIRNYSINLIAFQKIKRYINLYKIDIIHSNSSVIDIGYYLSKKYKLKHIWHLREFQDLDYNLRPFLGFENLKKKISHSYSIAITDIIANHYNLKNNYSVVYNGIEIKQRNIESVKKKQFVFCGNLSKNKGIEEAILAFCKFSKKNQGFQLIICGRANSENYLRYLETMVSSLNMKDDIIFKGFVLNKEEIISSSVALLMCSKFEALGRVTIEALMLKTLVIGRDTAGTKEIIKENLLYGLLYSDLDELVYNMELAISKPILIKDILKRSYQYAAMTFSLETYINNICNIYKEI